MRRKQAPQCDTIANIVTYTSRIQVCVVIRATATDSGHRIEYCSVLDFLKTVGIQRANRSYVLWFTLQFFCNKVFSQSPNGFNYQLKLILQKEND